MASLVDLPLDAIIKLNKVAKVKAPKAPTATAPKVAAPKVAGKAAKKSAGAPNAGAKIGTAAAPGKKANKRAVATAAALAATAVLHGSRRQRGRGAATQQQQGVFRVPAAAAVLAAAAPTSAAFPRRRGGGPQVLYTAARTPQQAIFKQTAPMFTHKHTAAFQASFAPSFIVAAPPPAAAAAAAAYLPAPGARTVTIPKGGLLTSRGKAKQLQKQQEQAFLREQHSQLTTGGSLIVSNLMDSVSEQDMKELFSSKGDVKNVVLRNGIARVVFAKKSAARDAMHEFNGVALDGQPMEIKMLDGGASAALGSHRSAQHDW